MARRTKEELNTMVNRVLAALKGTSITKRKTAASLAIDLGYSENSKAGEKDVLNCIRYLRLDGVKIASCATGDPRGFFIAKNAFEMEDTLKLLKDKQSGIEVTINALSVGPY